MKYQENKIFLLYQILVANQSPGVLVLIEQNPQDITSKALKRINK